MLTFIQFLESAKQEKKYSFSSVLYMLPEKYAKQVYSWGLEHIKESDVYKEPNDYGREDEMHCTVIYGIHDKLSSNVRKIIKDVKPFEITLGKISAFTVSEKYDVLKVEVSGKELHALHNLIKNNMKVTDKFPDYKPHVTIAYLKKGKAKDYIGENKFKSMVLKVEDVVFSSQSGSKTKICLKG